MDDTNPKDILGAQKVPLELVPPSSEIYQALAMQNGLKYGPYNWRTKKVRAMVYVGALRRHMAAWLDGENISPDSGVPHLGHALACLGILVDAIETGNLIDDRPAAGGAAKLLDRIHNDRKKENKDGQTTT